MGKMTISAVVGFLVMWCVVSAFGLGADHPADRPVGGSPEWPVGLVDLVNRDQRVHGFFVNANDFFFSGDTDALNEFLSFYAILKDTPLTLVLHPGGATAASPWDKETRTACEWEVSVLRRGWHPRAPEDSANKDARYVVMVDVWLGGQVELDTLQVPLSVEVKSGGEVEDFIAAHEERRRGEQSG